MTSSPPGVKGETRYDARGKLHLMAQAEGYVMVRRPYCAPFIMDFGAWLNLDDRPIPARKK